MLPTEDAMIEELAHLQRRMKILERALKAPSQSEQKEIHTDPTDPKEPSSKYTTTRSYTTIM